MAARSGNRKPPAGKSGTPKRRGGGFKSAASAARDQVTTMAGQKGFAETDVLLRWAEIAGAALAEVCRPVKVHYGAQRTLGATLVVQTTSGRAPEVEMQGPALIDRVNQFYGYRAIQRLKVTQSTGIGPVAGFAEAAKPFVGPGARADTKPTKADQTEAATLAEGISSPGLRDALTRMGAHILAQSRASRTGRQTKGPNP